jgi:hypothetical protein
MDNENPDRGEEEETPTEQPEWKVEGEESMDSMLEQTPPGDPSYDGGGMMIFTDEHGRRRRIPAERGTMSGRDLGAAARALQNDLGAAPRDYAKVALLERLNELRASGKMSEENFLKEKKRLGL